MAYELRDNSGTLFKNDKGDNPKRPDYRGDLLVEGVLYELSAWIKEGNKGKFMSLSVKPKEAKPAPKGKEPARRMVDDEEAPF